MRNSNPNFVFNNVRLLVATPATLRVYGLNGQKFEQKQIMSTPGTTYEKLVHVVESQRVFAAAADGSVCEVRRLHDDAWNCLARRSPNDLELVTAPLEAKSLLPNLRFHKEELVDLQVCSRSEYLYTLIVSRGETKVSVYNIQNKDQMSLETSFSFSHILIQLQEQLGS